MILMRKFDYSGPLSIMSFFDLWTCGRTLRDLGLGYWLVDKNWGRGLPDVAPENYP